MLAFEEDVVRLIYGYALESGKCLQEKPSFNKELKGEWYMQHQLHSSVLGPLKWTYGLAY